MSSGIEPVELVDPWLYATFSGDPTLTAIVGNRITNGAALGALATPLLTWDMNSSRDITTAEGAVLWNESLFEIKAVGHGGSFAVPTRVARRVQELIGMATNVKTAQGGVITCRRERVIRYPELDDNVQYRHVGGIYRITAHT